MSLTETGTNVEAPKPGAEAPIRMTEAALQQVRWLLARQNDPALFLRIGVKGGGCTGYSYVLDLQTEKTDWDTQYDFDGVPVVIDRKSRKLLEGTTIDFDTANLMLGGGFLFRNPNAKKTCGCGTSFAT